MAHGQYGRTVARFRKAKGLTQTDLGVRAGVAQNTISNVENDKIKSGVRPGDMVRISSALDEPEVLVAFCQACPIRPHVFPAGVTSDPAASLDKLRSDMELAAVLALDLSTRLSDPGFRDSLEFKSGLERFSDIKRVIDALGADLLPADCSAGCAR